MVRAALVPKRRVGKGPRRLARFIPALSVMAASLLNALPIVSTSGWYPDFGFLALLAWRLLRSDPWPGWWAAPLGLFDDLVTGHPLGLSIFLWSASMLLLELLDRRTMWRDYWIEWGLAAVLLLISTAVHWRVTAAAGAIVPFSAMAPSLLFSIVGFPVAAGLVAAIDRWRLGR